MEILHGLHSGFASKSRVPNALNPTVTTVEAAGLFPGRIRASFVVCLNLKPRSNPVPKHQVPAVGTVVWPSTRCGGLRSAAANGRQP